MEWRKPRPARGDIDDVIFDRAGCAAGGDKTRDDGKNCNEWKTPGHSSLLLANPRDTTKLFLATSAYFGSAEPGL